MRLRPWMQRWLMAEFHCPQDLRDLVMDDPAEGRKKVIEWLKSLSPSPGDKAFIPGTDGGTATMTFKGRRS